MPNVQQVEVIGLIAEKGMANLAPAVAERIAADLPVIFGGSAGKAADVLAKAPLDAPVLEKLGHEFQQNLSRFGLPKTGTPTDLFEAAKNDGLDPQYQNGTKGRNHMTSTHELALGDGNVLRQVYAGGRSLAFRETSFLNSERDAQLSFKAGHYTGKHSQTWRINTPSISHEITVRQ